MSIQQILIAEIPRQPEPLLREVWHYLNFLKSRAAAGDAQPRPSPRRGHGSVPGIVLADDFDALLPEFADYRP